MTGIKTKLSHGPHSGHGNTNPDWDTQTGFDNPGSADNVSFLPDLWQAASGSRPGGASGTGTTVTSASVTTVTTTSSPLKVNITWDSSVGAAPSGFTAGVIAAVKYLESQFSDAVTLNIAVGYGEVGGTALGSYALGESQSYLMSVSYSQLVNALKADTLSASDASVVASLAATSPVSGTYWLTTAQAKALGLNSATATSNDGNVGFSSTLPFTYNDSSGVAAGTYDFNGTVLHEITEVMGRQLMTGSTIGTTANSYSLLDLLHYSSPGVRDFSASTAGYFSVDGGTTNLGNFNTVSGGDAGDWASSVTNDALDAFSSSGVVEAFTSADLTELDAIGWNPAGTPAGVAISPLTASLSADQGINGLNAGAALASIVQTGGSTGDSYTYALGGSGAGAFSLASSNNAATLSTGSSAVAGAVKGQLYSLAVTATDTTTGHASVAFPVNVVVGGSGSDTISLTSLSGVVTSAPTFIYGLAGNDSINGTGMTGRLYFDGGAGADTMTGGSGINDYLFGAVGDSTVTTMDTITNFHVAMDLIDLTGLGTTLKYAGQISSSSKSIAAGSVGWQTSGGNTYIYANTSSASEALTAVNMKIGLQGSVSLSSSNILHV